MKEIDYEILAEKYLELYTFSAGTKPKVVSSGVLREREIIRNFAKWLNREKNSDEKSS
jgi:hypothetical protein